MKMVLFCATYLIVDDLKCCYMQHMFQLGMVDETGL